MCWLLHGTVFSVLLSQRVNTLDEKARVFEAACKPRQKFSDVLE